MDAEQEEFQEDLEIDPNELDVEALRQPNLFFKWSERMVKAKEEADYRDHKADQKLAELQGLIRSKPSKFGIRDKVTETAVKSVAENHADYHTALQKARSARTRYGIMQSRVSAMDQKKRSIEDLIKLHGQNYFAGPSIPHDIAAAYKAKKRQYKQMARERSRRPGEGRED